LSTFPKGGRLSLLRDTHGMIPLGRSQSGTIVNPSYGARGFDGVFLDEGNNTK
jgi:hypothetical protein